jgi:hypothetical protein
MNLLDAVKSLQQFKRPNWDHSVQFFKAQTGPFVYIVGCDYFVTYSEYQEPYLTTSMDLYPDDILSTDYLTKDSFYK